MKWNSLPFATRVWIAHRALIVSRRQQSDDFILAQAIAAHPEQPKWRFLTASAEANMVTRAALSRDLIRDFPQFEGGYQSLLFTHLTDLAYKSSPDQENPLPEGDLAADLPSIEHYCQAFPQARYGRMAAVFRNVMLDDPEAAEQSLEFVQRILGADFCHPAPT